ncbi:phage holin family protein [Portibacter marinus]|uniref:phage holin family protein n=1 Tax=Portibacter marinus TaxID=2898660 RepID=UPI001F3B96EB|nr:phage holin family protein [Portibacter marinus]
MEWILNIIITAAAFFIGAKLLPGVTISDILQAVVVALVVAVLDFTLGNFLRIVSLGLLTLSIFNWLLNAILILVADWFLPKFKVKNFWWALGLAAVVSLTSALIDKIF